MKIKYKIIAPTVLIFIISFSVLFFTMKDNLTDQFLQLTKLAAEKELQGYYDQFNNMENMMESYEEAKLADVKERLLNLIQTAEDGVEYFVWLEKSGQMIEEEAKENAKEYLRNLTYGEDGYFWADTSEYINIVLPPDPSVEGTYRGDLVDKRGNSFLKEIVDGAIGSDHKFTEYWFPKPGESKASEKLGVSIYIEEWNWIVGTGEYIDNIEEEVGEIEKQYKFNIRASMYSEKEFASGTIQEIFKGAYPVVLNSSAEFVYYVDPALEGKSPDLRDFKTDEPILPQFVEKKSGQLTYYYSKDGDNKAHLKHAVLKYNESLDYVIAFTFYQDDIDKAINELFLELMTMLTISALLILGIIILIITLITKNINKTNRLLYNISQEDGDLTSRLEVKSKDELKDLSNSFNTFIDKQRNLIVDVKSAIQGANETKQNISSSTEETSTAIEQINSNLSSIGKQVNKLNENLNSTVTSIEQITSNIGSMDNQINDQAAMVEESTAAITEMMASLDNMDSITKSRREATEELKNVVASGSGQLETTNSTFAEKVVSKIDSISEMADTINEIASQTNLLSMNAAIEAAHAGEAGRGFAVVAEEIRKLAESAGKSSKSITTTIKDIVAGVDETGESAQKTSEAFKLIDKEVEETVNSFLEIESSITELNTSGKQIVEASNQINDITLNTRNSSNEIKDGADTILNSSENIKEISEQVNAGMAEAQTGASEIVQSMQLMVQLTQDLDHVVNELNKKFGQFKTE